MMKTNHKYIYLSLFLILFFNCSENKISITGKGNITGKVVTLGDNEPLENVKISTNPSTSIVFTNASGNFTIVDAPVNDYSIQAEKEGFLTKFEGITVIDESNVNVIFELDIDTANNRAPDSPILESPADNTTDLEVEVELVWSGFDEDGDDLTYTIEILNDQNSEVIEITELVDTTYVVTGLQYGYKYFWQVAASDGINDPSLSDVFSFETLEFPDNRHFFTRKINGNNVIFSADSDGNEFQLTSSSTNSWRPRKGDNTDKLAFLRTNGGETHIFTMNLDGSDVFQVTNAVPVNGFNLEELDFSWKSNDIRIIYPSFDKLYQISPNGAALGQIHQTPNGNFISEVDWNQETGIIAVKTNDSNGYNASIYTINSGGVIQDIVIDNVNGALGGLDLSFDGTKLLYTQDITGSENSEYRQLDTNMFIYDFNTSTSTNVSAGKLAGTNDLDPRFSPNEAELIFVNTSNDGVSQQDILVIQIGGTPEREAFIEDGKMPDWK